MNNVTTYAMYKVHLCILVSMLMVSFIHGNLHSLSSRNRITNTKFYICYKGHSYITMLIIHLRYEKPFKSFRRFLKTFFDGFHFHKMTTLNSTYKSDEA